MNVVSYTLFDFSIDSLGPRRLNSGLSGTTSRDTNTESSRRLRQSLSGNDIMHITSIPRQLFTHGLLDWSPVLM